MRETIAKFWLVTAVLLLAQAGIYAADKKADRAPKDSGAPVSFHREIMPLLTRNCNGCHQPNKSKGDLDMTTHEKLLKGGKHGPAFKPNDRKSNLLEYVIGPEPKMPDDGDPLKPAEIALLERWIMQGGKDDTPANLTPKELPVYKAPPVISALAYSPDGATLAVSGYYEVLLLKSDGSALVSRLMGEAPRIEAIAYSADGKLIGVAGGAPGVYGSVQLWEHAEKKQTLTLRLTGDSVYGISFNPKHDRIAIGCGDKTVRMFSLPDGKEVLRLENHVDWVFNTTFTLDGTKLLSASRDRAMKMIDATNAQFIDDINKLVEPILCMVRHPKADQVLYGGGNGTPRIYNISDNQKRTAGNNDVNMVKEFERQLTPVQSCAFSPDGNTIAIGTLGGIIKLFNVADGKKLAEMSGFQGGVFSLVFHPKEAQLAAGCFDGKIRLFEVPSGKLLKEFIPVPMNGSDKVGAN